MDDLDHSAVRNQPPDKSSIDAALDPIPNGENHNVALLQLRKERCKELAKHGKNSEVMESQSVTPMALARDGFLGAVLALGKFARLRFFLHDVEPRKPCAKQQEIWQRSARG
jgi:hypothetical protein